VLDEVIEQRAAVIEDLGPRRDAHDEVLAISARTVIGAAGLAVAGELALPVAQIDEGSEVGVYAEVDMTPPAPVTAVWATPRNKLLTAEANRSVAAMS